jgi:hypothetical protein
MDSGHSVELPGMSISAPRGSELMNPACDVFSVGRSSATLNWHATKMTTSISGDDVDYEYPKIDLGWVEDGAVPWSD